MLLNEKEIHVWTLDTRAIRHYDELVLLLSPDENKHAKTIEFRQHHHRYIATRYYLRKLLSNYLQIEPEEVEIARTSLQKPYVKNSLLKFNLTHSQHLILFAFCMNAEIGVDIEFNQRETLSPLTIANRYFHPHEATRLKQLSDDAQRVAFYNLWSRKEAVAKALGLGLTIGLNTFSLSEQPIKETVHLHNQQWYIYPMQLCNSFSNAIAINHAISHIRYMKLNELG